MNETTITAILSLLGTLIGSFSAIMVANKLTNYRIEQLEKKVDKHNSVVERVYKLEQKDAVTEESLKVVNHRISDLEAYHH